jgi:transposase/GNAT superfamily N-acetyltransferase
MSLYLVAANPASTATPAGGHLPTRRRRAYPSDTTDGEWQILAPLVPVGGPPPGRGGRPVTYPRRDIIDAIRYLDHNGCVWRALPVDFPSRSLVAHYFTAWTRDGTLTRIHARGLDRRRDAAAICGGSLVASRPIRWLGERANSIYLWNILARIAIINPLGRTVVGDIVWTAMFAVLAEASFRFVKRPLRARFARRPGVARPVARPVPAPGPYRSPSDRVSRRRIRRPENPAYDHLSYDRRDRTPEASPGCSEINADGPAAARRDDRADEREPCCGECRGRSHAHRILPDLRVAVADTGRQIAADPGRARWVARAVIAEPEGVVAGHAGFHGPPDEAGMVEVAYSVDPVQRRRGYARAMLRDLLQRASTEPAVKTVRATISPDNAAPLATLSGFGFARVGEQWDEEDGLEIVFEVPAGRAALTG